MIEWIYMGVIEAGEPYFYVHQIISHLIRALSVGSDRHGRLPANNVACGAHRPLEKVEYTTSGSVIGCVNRAEKTLVHCPIFLRPFRSIYMKDVF